MEIEIAKGDQELATQLTTFCQKAPGYATLLGLVAADITALDNDRKLFIFILAFIDTITTSKQGYVAYKNLLSVLNSF